MAVARRIRGDIIPAGCLASVVAGDVVRISGPPVGAVYQVVILDIDASPARPVFGVVRDKVSSTLCLVQVAGELGGVYSGFTAGQQLFVDTSSRLVDSPPSRPVSGTRLVYPVAIALSADTVLIRILAPTIILPV